jgi:hypothetical protein
MLIIVCWTDIKMFQLDKIIFIHFRKDLSSCFHLWNRKKLKKIQNIIKIFRIFSPKFFLFRSFKSVSKNQRNNYFNFFMDAYIFSDRCLKNHKIFIFNFLSTFLEILWKFSQNQDQNFLLVVFEFFIKNQAKSLQGGPIFPKVFWQKNSEILAHSEIWITVGL